MGSELQLKSNGYTIHMKDVSFSPNTEEQGVAVSMTKWADLCREDLELLFNTMETICEDTTMAKWDIPMYQLEDNSVMRMVKEFAEVTQQVPNLEMSAALIREEFFEWVDERFLHEHTKHGDPVKELKELSDLVYVAYGYANARGWDLDEAVRRVHQDNIGRCVQPDGTIKRREDGKILRNQDYPAVELGDLV